LLGQVLSLWTRRALLPSAVLQPEAERLQERLQAHNLAAAAREIEKAAAQSSRAADRTIGSTILRWASHTFSPMAPHDLLETCTAHYGWFS